MKSLLPNSAVYIDDLLRKCFPELGEHVDQLVEVHLTELANERSFWSQIVKVKLNWKDTVLHGTYPKSMFIKLPFLSQNAELSEAHGLADTLVDFTHHEILFYKMKRNEVIPLCPMPRYYYGEEMNEHKEGGLLVMEDIGENATSMEYAPGLTMPQMEVVIDALAGFHHYIISSPQEWCSVFNRLDVEFIQEQFDCAMRLEEIKPEWFKGKIEKMKPYFTQDVAEKAISSFEELGIPPVLIHSDLNVTNILWDRNTIHTNTPKLLALIDFQLMHQGNICEDIARVLMLSISVENRRVHTRSLLQRYHSTLTTLFNGAPPFSLEKVVKAYDRIFFYSSMFVLFGLPLYYEMYETMEKDETVREGKRMELLTRAKGVVDDALDYIQQGKA